MAKVRVTDLAKRMGVSDKDLIFKLQSLGVAVDAPSSAIDPEVVMAILSGKKTAAKPRNVIMREEKPAEEAAKKATVRPPRPIVAPPPRRVATPPAEPPVGTTTPTPIIPEFIQAAEAEAAEQARAEKETPVVKKTRKSAAAAAAEAAPVAEAPVTHEPAAAAPNDAQQPTPAPATEAPERPAAAASSPTGAPRPSAPRPTGPTGPRAGAINAPRPNYQSQDRPPQQRFDRGPAGQGQGQGQGNYRPAGPGGPGQGQYRPAGGPGGRPGAPMGARPQGQGGYQGQGGGYQGQRPQGGPGGYRPAGPGGAPGRPGMGARPGGPGGRPMGPGGPRPMGRPGQGGMMPPPPPPGPAGPLDRKRKTKGEDERPEKKKATGKRGVKNVNAVVEDDPNLFTKRAYSAAAVLDDDQADFVRPVREDGDAEEEQIVRPVSSRRDARKQAGPVSARVLEFKRPTAKVSLSEGVTVKELADKLGVKANDLMKHLLMKKGMMLSINAPLGAELALSIAKDLDIDAEIVSFEEAAELESLEKMATTTGAGAVSRAPVITVMGHVDHGKTSLLDAIRETNVAAGEAGGITQHIGAYTVEKRGRKIVFLDTPGHEAFTMMRARGAKVTDIVVLVVAADDGVMPQTKEAISHAQAAKVPMIVAINKIDKPNANVDRVKQELAGAGVLVQQWGGEIESVEVSALKKQGIDDLLEVILLTADIQDMKATPELPARGVVLEARKEVGRGIVANVLVQDGTLRIGDPFFSGLTTGRVRAMVDDHGNRLKEAGPATPLSVTGFDEVPNAGDAFVVVDEEAQARLIAEQRQQKAREAAMQKGSRMSLDQLFQKMQTGTVKELNLIVKADVQGSVEVLNDTLRKLSNDQVRINIIHSSVGAISTNDVLLASASDAIVVGFNVRPERSATELAEKEGVEFRLHTVIYQLTDEIKLAMTGLLEPTTKEVFQGRAEVRDTFKVPKAGTIAGCMVTEGIIPRTASVRLLRDNRVIFEGKLASLRHFKNDVSEVRQGFECGIGIERFQDIKVGDVIEAFKMETTAGVLQ